MSLPPLLKHIYNYGSEEVIRRGKKIFFGGGVQLLDVDHLLDQVRFKVRNDQYYNHYNVTVKEFSSDKKLSVRCQCPYNLGEICRHEVAALMQLNELSQTGFFENADLVYDQKHTVVRMRQVSYSLLSVFASEKIMEQAENMANRQAAIIISAKDDKIIAEVPEGVQTYKVIIKQNEERYFDTSCNCHETKFPLCVHKAAVFLQVMKTYGKQYFQTMRNWDEQKNRLLRLYGYSLEDNLENKFEFTYDNGKPFLKVLDPTIKKIETTTPVKIEKATDDDKRLGIVINFSVTNFPYVQIDLIAGEAGRKDESFSGTIELLALNQYISPQQFLEEDRALLPVIRKFSEREVVKYVTKNLPFGDIMDEERLLDEHPSKEIKEQVWEYLLPKYQKLFNKYEHHSLCFLQEKQTIHSGSIEPIIFSPHHLKLQLQVQKNNEGVSIQAAWLNGAVVIPFKETKLLNHALIQHENYLHTVAHLATVNILDALLPDGKIHIPEKDWDAFLENTLMDWVKEVAVEFDDKLTKEIIVEHPQYQIHLREREQLLILKPSFVYQNMVVAPTDFGAVLKPENGIIKLIKRNEEAEENLLQHIRNLHTDMQYNSREGYYYLPAKAVLQNNWFFRFTDEMKELGVTLYGYENLKQLRVNKHKPVTSIALSSGVDWFDANIQLSFGDQQIALTDIKKTISQKQNYVRLDDGSLGMLPEEWVKKYALLLKVGEVKEGKIRLKKYHFTAIDQLLLEQDNEALQIELEHKKQRLDKIIGNDYAALAPPPELVAQLRPYQNSGYQWLSFLREAGWGGILADDMGLGKTVQALAALQQYKNEQQHINCLVVCPTTLLYNWENELKKFTPGLSYVIHHGPKRDPDMEDLKETDVIITTYGTMRSDIKMFAGHEFDYIVLDESQAIKNPQSQVSKASLLLKAKHKIALSGTPIQNNTFDLYAQMNFLNPGMLGSREYFNNEFATPIDKFQEQEEKEQLKKLLYPFLLRRTKEQVAKDLPEKTETILYCEMGKEQRRIYDAYRNEYRSSILGMIEEQGVERSTMHILQGLTKLRQICDSPAILNEEVVYPNHSIKLDELMREIEENVGNHKALVFSQFIGMLSLIRKKLEEKNIPYAYFDGSTTAPQREKAIQEFQQNEDCRIFLISLKAGGIGLNLTAADYVYIVDPWWNPAVEQQAIDRTHRIGQTKNIFAYRMICKDTIEEKIATLQERKRLLAKELIADDNAFLKRLTSDDIAYLLS